MAALAYALVRAVLDDSPERRSAVVEAARREGSVAVKLLQLAVSSGHIGGGLAECIREELLSRALPQPWDEMRAALEAFGEARPELKAPDSPAEVASGALAQVVVLDGVAYKVTHAGAEASVARLRRALSHSWLPVPHRSEMLRYLDGIESQLDMRAESDRLKAAREAWGESRALRIPRPLGATRRVLAMTAEPARPPRGAAARDLAAVASYAMWALHLSSSDVHGDLHAGNYGLFDGGAALYDFGATLRVSPEQRACASAIDVGDFRGAFAAMSACGPDGEASRNFEARVRERLARGEGVGDAMRRSWPLRAPVPFRDLARCSFSTQVASLERAAGLEPALPDVGAELLRATAAVKRAALAAMVHDARFDALRDEYLGTIHEELRCDAASLARELYASVSEGTRSLTRARGPWGPGDRSEESEATDSSRSWTLQRFRARWPRRCVGREARGRAGTSRRAS